MTVGFHGPWHHIWPSEAPCPEGAGHTIVWNMSLRYSATFAPISQPSVLPSGCSLSMDFQTHLQDPRKKTRHSLAHTCEAFSSSSLGAHIPLRVLWPGWFLASQSFHVPDPKCHRCDGNTYLEVRPAWAFGLCLCATKLICPLAEFPSTSDQPFIFLPSQPERSYIVQASPRLTWSLKRPETDQVASNFRLQAGQLCHL